jgi:hypothetical protein
MAAIQAANAACTENIDFAASRPARQVPGI